MEQGPKKSDGRSKRRVRRHSPHRLLRQKVILPGDIIVSAEKHRGRLVVRVEEPEEQGGPSSPTPRAIHLNADGV